MTCAGGGFLEDFVEYCILPGLALQSREIMQQQEEMAIRLFELLSAQNRWILVYQILNKCARSLVNSSQYLPAVLREPLQTLLLPPDVTLVQASSLHFRKAYVAQPFC